MGELIDFVEWKRSKEEKDRIELEEDIARLQKEVQAIISEMGEPNASMFWDQGFLDTLPELIRLDSLICGYSEAFYSDTDRADTNDRCED